MVPPLSDVQGKMYQYDFEGRPEYGRPSFHDSLPPELLSREMEFNFGGRPNLNQRQFRDDYQLPRHLHQPSDMERQVTGGFPPLPEEEFRWRTRRSFDEFGTAPDFPPHQNSGDHYKEYPMESYPTREIDFRNRGRVPSQIAGHHRHSFDKEFSHASVDDLSRMLETHNIQDVSLTPLNHRLSHSFHLSELDLNALRWSPPKHNQSERKQTPSPKSVYDFVDAGHPSRLPTPPQNSSVNRQKWCPSDSPPRTGALNFDAVEFQQCSKNMAGESAVGPRSLDDFLPSQEEFEVLFAGGCTK